MTIDVKETTMKSRRAIPGGLIQTAGFRLLPLLLLPLFGLWGCGGAQAEDPNPENGYTRVINVEVQRVQPSTFTEVVRLTGTVQANQDVMISAEEGGVVREILVDKGSRVSAGDALFRLDDDLLLAQVDQARALSAMAGETWERRKRLYEEDGVGSELVYLEAKYAAEQAAANLRLLEERLERTVITAPIGGVLDSREIEIGSMVAAGTPVARIVDANPVKITAGVPERYAADVAVGARAVVTFDVLPGQEFSGTLSYAGVAVNARNRTFPVEVVLPNPGGVIKPEMVANVSVVRRTYGEAIVVPQEALVRTEGGYIVFVVEEDGEATLVQARQVEAGPAQRNEVMIRSGLEAGERLVVVGQQSVASGDHVNIVAER
jgi:membrane fusion protein (multidrug efflux system)